MLTNSCDLRFRDCAACGYLLTGLEAGAVCPECGLPVHCSALRPQLTFDSWRAAARYRAGIAAVAALMLLRTCLYLTMSVVMRFMMQLAQSGHRRPIKLVAVGYQDGIPVAEILIALAIAWTVWPQRRASRPFTRLTAWVIIAAGALSPLRAYPEFFHSPTDPGASYGAGMTRLLIDYAIFFFTLAPVVLAGALFPIHLLSLLRIRRTRLLTGLVTLVSAVSLACWALKLFAGFIRYSYFLQLPLGFDINAPWTFSAIEPDDPAGMIGTLSGLAAALILLPLLRPGLRSRIPTHEAAAH